jgi:hypothetical protein
MMQLKFPIEMLGQSIKVQVYVSDGVNTTMGEFNVFITDNYPPILLKPLPDIFMLEDIMLRGAIDLKNYFIDPDEEPLTFSISLEDQDNIDVVIHPNGSVDIMSSLNWYGSTSGIVRAEDKSHSFIEQSITISVIPVNDPPAVDIIPDQYGKAGWQWILDLEPYLIDVDNDLSELEIDIDENSTKFVTITGNSLTFQSRTAVSQNIKIFISDGVHTTTGEIKLIISEESQAKPQTNMEAIWILSIIIILIIIGIMMVVFRSLRGSFSLTDIFIIHRDGLLIKYKGSTFDEDMDEDIFSGMLTGIQTFISESFGSNLAKADSKWIMNQLKMGKYEMMVQEGKNIILVGVYKGKPGRRLSRKLSEMITKIENSYDKRLTNWDGQLQSVKGIEKLIEPYLNGKNK